MTTAAAARTEILAERASALLVVLDGSPENLRGKTRLGMALLAHLATELAGVPMFARNVGDVLDIAGVWRHHNASYTTSTHWLKPETRTALVAIAEKPHADRPPAPDAKIAHGTQLEIKIPFPG